jgi:hypothetical protein
MKIVRLARWQIWYVAASHKHRKVRAMLSSVLERLRASKDQYVQHAGKKGREAGRFWATTEAEYHQLRRVANHWESRHEVVVGALKRLIDPDPELSMDDFNVVVNCEGLFEKSNEWARGFAQGASEVYREFKEETEEYKEEIEE